MDVLDGYTVETRQGQVILTLTAVFGDTIEYQITPADAAMIGASLLIHAVDLHTT